MIWCVCVRARSPRTPQGCQQAPWGGVQARAHGTRTTPLRNQADPEGKKEWPGGSKRMRRVEGLEIESDLLPQWLHAKDARQRMGSMVVAR
jgi:hypothetical protein